MRCNCMIAHFKVDGDLPPFSICDDQVSSHILAEQLTTKIFWRSKLKLFHALLINQSLGPPQVPDEGVVTHSKLASQSVGLMSGYGSKVNATGMCFSSQRTIWHQQESGEVIG